MKLRKITFVFLALIGNICSTEIGTRTLESAESAELITEALVNILASCYGNKETAIGLHGNFPGTFIETLWSRKLIPIYIINNTDCGPVPKFHRRELNVFVILATTWQQILLGFQQVHCGRFYNSKASYLIVDWTPTEKYGCYRVTDLFYMAKFTRHFNVNILCLHPTKGRIIFGYNPHSYQAPAPWKLTENVKYRDNRTLSLIEREYRQKGVCKNLDFEKANDLHGSPIEVLTDRTTMDNRSLFVRMSKLKRMQTYIFVLEAANIIKNFVRRLNGTLKIIITKSAFDKTEDLSTRRVNSGSRFVSSMSYPCMQLDLVILTNFEGYKSQLRKILTVVDAYSRCGTCLALFVTLLFFKCVARQALIPAILNVVRITCNTGFTNLPENRVSRIYLTGLLFFAVTMHGIFSGNLASLLTRDVPVEHVETVQDLINRNYTIYVLHAFGHLFADPMHEGHVVLLDPYSSSPCGTYLLRDPSGACVHTAHAVHDYLMESNFHVSSNVVFTQYWSFQTQHDWPFMKQFNKVHITMTEANIVDTFPARLIRNRLSYVEPPNEDPKVMTLKDLGFAFVILGIGLACATISFIVEISIKPIRQAIAKVRRRPFYSFRKIKIQKFKVRK